MIQKLTIVYIILAIIIYGLSIFTCRIYKDKRFMKLGWIFIIVLIVFYTISLLSIVIERIKLSGM